MEIRDTGKEIIIALQKKHFERVTKLKKEWKIGNMTKKKILLKHTSCGSFNSVYIINEIDSFAIRDEEPTVSHCAWAQGDTCAWCYLTNKD